MSNENRRERRPTFKDPQFNYQVTKTGRFQSVRPNLSNTPKTNRPNRSPRKPKGPPTVSPKVPKSGKQCKHMAKAAAFRIARLIRAKPTVVYRHPSPLDLVSTILPPRSKGRGEAMNLARKMIRLRKWYDKLPMT